jgi:diamine N-acetyltransferase
LELNVNIQKACNADIDSIVQLAYNTWPNTYGTIISQEQIQYMLQLFYNTPLIQEQINDESQFFWVAKIDNELAGYAHFKPYDKNIDNIYLSKLYVLPKYQGKKIGLVLMNFAEKFFKEKFKAIYLNVNRYNPAKLFYTKIGFEIIEEVDIPLDKYWLNDYVMKKNIQL